MSDWKVTALLLAATALALSATLIPGAGISKAGTASSPQPASAADRPLSSLSGSITSESPEARDAFDRGVRLAFRFDHGNAVHAFKEAQKLDPGCAMCFWGEAWALGPNVNAPMQAEARQPASDALRRARQLARNASGKEKALIGALEARYFDASDADPSDQEDPGREILDLAFAHAMGAVHRRFPGDDDIAVLFAEAMMNLSSRDDSEADAQTPKGRTFEIISLLESVLARNPDHAAAIGLYIHVMEASGIPEASELCADRLSARTTECSAGPSGSGRQ